MVECQELVIHPTPASVAMTVKERRKTAATTKLKIQRTMSTYIRAPRGQLVSHEYGDSIGRATAHSWPKRWPNVPLGSTIFATINYLANRDLGHLLRRTLSLSLVAVELNEKQALIDRGATFRLSAHSGSRLSVTTVITVHAKQGFIRPLGRNLVAHTCVHKTAVGGWPRRP